jgi:phosphate/sulfate permease
MSNQMGGQASAQGGNRNRTIIIVVVILVLCCCCAAIGVGLYLNGDQLIKLISPTPATPLLLKLLA